MTSARSPLFLSQCTAAIKKPRTERSMSVPPAAQHPIIAAVITEAAPGPKKIEQKQYQLLKLLKIS
ncbi:hypothetical protein [Candidatus Chlamydia corallus]|uniref:hypothetical protein n=1 Tax=Candidatus Chlamydia corallus TaxID=2038470 RepID=UPI000C2F90C8|nr:hypothetical protein [Candidatus Chlamydia corallus]